MWNQELVELLITKYQEHENLYNFRIPEYSDREMRSYSMLAICQELQTLNKDVTVADIKNKIRSLRSNFSKESREIAKSKMSGVSAENVYVPTVWYFPRLQFLQAHCIARKAEERLENCPYFQTDDSDSRGIKNEHKTQPSSNKRSDCLEINQNSCRICLEQGAIVDWNEEILDSCSTTYKHCYFKYTQLDENDADTFPQLLCETCSHDLKTFHFLIEKALESNGILQQTFSAFSQQIEIDEKFEIKDLLELSMVDETLEVSKDVRKEGVNKKTKITKINSKKNSSKHHEDNTCKKKQIKLEKDEEEEELIDNPNSENEQNFDSPPSSPLLEKPVQDEEEEELIDIPNSESEPNSDSLPSSPLLEKRVQPQDRKITCAYCPKLIVAQYMKEHERTHLEHRERSHVCTKCGLKFFTKKSLNNHMDVHKDNREKRYKCEFCDKAYFNRGACNVHRRVHLGQMKTCTICSKDFSRQCDLDSHTSRVHSTAPLNTIVTTKKKYLVECKVCGKEIASNNWKHHQLLHSNNFQMKCTLCDKHFASKISCHRHVRRFHKYTDDVANVVEYYGDEINRRSTLLMLKQTEIVKPVLGNK